MPKESNPLAIATGQEHESLAKLLKTDAYSRRFEQVLGPRAPQFISSLIAVGNTMQDVAPRSIIGSAMTAACLDLPIDKNLGFAWIVPYKGVATFQMGYKGYIQLGQRSAQYKRMNAVAINREVFKGYDSVGEPVLDWEQYDPDAEVWGYFFGFELINGFTKCAVWSKEKVTAHARKYSQSFRSGAEIWIKQFDGMALKTVIANTLRKWGPLSIQMQQAFQSDQAVIRDIDAIPEYVDEAGAETTTEKPVGEHPEKKKQREAQELADTLKDNAKNKEAAASKLNGSKPSPDEKEEAAMGLAPEQKQKTTPENVVPMAAAAAATTTEAKVESKAETKPAEPEPEKPEAKVEAKPETAVLTEKQAKFKAAMEEAGFNFDQFRDFAAGKFLPKKSDPTCPKDWIQITDERAGWFLASVKGLIAAMKKGK